MSSPSPSTKVLVLVHVCRDVCRDKRAWGALHALRFGVHLRRLDVVCDVVRACCVVFRVSSPQATLLKYAASSLKCSKISQASQPQTLEQNEMVSPEMSRERETKEDETTESERQILLSAFCCHNTPRVSARARLALYFERSNSPILRSTPSHSFSLLSFVPLAWI
jgi:hypothetical protein